MIKKICLVLCVLVGVFFTVHATKFGFSSASLDYQAGAPVLPDLSLESAETWLAQREEVKSAFETHLYGPWPGDLARRRVSRRMVNDTYSDGRATLEEWVIEIGDGPGARRFHLAVALPVGAPQSPLILAQSFMPNCYVFGDPGLTAPDGETCAGKEMSGFVGWLAEVLLGPYITEAPIDQYIEAGFGYANFYASELVPDNRDTARDVMANLSADASKTPTGALMAWGFGFSAVLDVMQDIEAIDANRVAIMGHSRHGKAALLTGAWDNRFAAVISHQSGTGGAALSQSPTGEGLERMIDGTPIILMLHQAGYPHWLAPNAMDMATDLDALPVEQHQLLALNAPRPVFLGNGREDVWSDPTSTYRAARAASPIYSELGGQGVTTDSMLAYHAEDGLAYFMNPHGHGIRQSDVDAILAFLAAHIPPNGEG